MKKMFNIGFMVAVLSVCLVATDGFAAKSNSAKKQAAISFGTKVRTKVEAKGIYDQECYDKYYACMDQFCIVDNEMGGSCNCSDDITQYETALDEIQKMIAEAERISTEEVEKVKAGANADIIFGGTRTYDENNNVVATTATKDKEVAKQSMWSAFYESEDEEEEDDSPISSKTGSALYQAAHELCEEELGKSCEKDMDMLTQIYSRQIVSDCKGLANSIEQKKQEAKTQLAQASADVRAALKESLEESNKYDRGTCMVEYKKCMMSADACGSDWGECVNTIASENMQNNKAKSVKGKEVETVISYNITPSTMERLESKRFICEKVLDSCVAVRDYVWGDFIRDVAPTIRLAEQNIESKKRQSCLSDISACIQKACKDDIAGKGEATMDACLARPDMARSFCKIQIDPCERMEPQIWDYVKSKLAAMRVDACTQEVKDCYMADDRCGPDFSNCIGMDYNYIHDICPIDKLVVCKQANPNFKMTDLDEMLMGLYLNVDNKALENCERIAEEKMVELCGSSTDCDKFATDEYIGTSSVKSQKDGAIYRVTGMISFGSIKMGDASGTTVDGGRKLLPGEIGVDSYISEVRKKNKGVQNGEGIITSIEEELKNIAGTINRTISLIESDQRIQYCINGRDLSQINGQDNRNGKNTTQARFPNLLNQYRVMIAISALRKAQDNYNKKVSEAIAQAAHDSSADVAQFLCQRMADVGNKTIIGNVFEDTTPLTAPFAITYDVGAGFDNKTLASMAPTGSDQGEDWDKDMNVTGSKTTRTATFDRNTRKCHVCSTVTTKRCYKKKWQYASSYKVCDKPEVTDPMCEDISM